MILDEVFVISGMIKVEVSVVSCCIYLFKVQRPENESSGYVI